MALLGNQNILGNFPNDKFAGNGSQTAFTLSQTPASVTSLDVYISGVKQDTANYSVSGKTLTFTTAPPSPASGVVNNIEVCYKGVLGSINSPAAGTVTKQSMATPYYAARMYRNAAFTTTASNTVKVPLDTTSFDSSGLNWCVVANGRILPTIAGYYQVSAGAGFGNYTSGRAVQLLLWKNGATINNGVIERAASTLNVSLSDVVYLNGTTDYLEIAVYDDFAEALQVGSINTYIALIGPF